MHHANAQTVIDNETKYRGGIRIGNFAEEILAKDYQTQIDDQNKQKMGQTMNKTLHGLGSSTLNYKIEQKTRQQKEYDSNINCRGDKAYILFGHGLNTNDNSEFIKREFRTTNELAYNQKIKPQTFVSSKFHPQTIGGRETLTFINQQKTTYNNYQTDLQKLGQNIIDEPKNYRHYDQFTKTFDATNFKLDLRK